MTADTFAASSAQPAGNGAARPGYVRGTCYEQHSLPRLHLRGRILLEQVTPSECDGQDDVDAGHGRRLPRTGAQKTDTEDVINMLLTVKGVEIARVVRRVGADGDRR